MASKRSKLVVIVFEKETWSGFGRLVLKTGRTRQTRLKANPVRAFPVAVRAFPEKARTATQLWQCEKNSHSKAGKARTATGKARTATGKARTATQLDALAQKLARAGNFSKSCQAVCSDSTPSLGPHTLAKLQAKNAQGSVDFDKTFWRSAADMDVLRQKDDWRRVAKEHFSVDNIRKYFALSPFKRAGC